MGAAVVWFLESSVGQWLIKTLVTHLYDYLKEEIEAYEKRKATEDAAKASVDPLKKAQTGKEIDDAARDSADGI